MAQDTNTQVNKYLYNKGCTKKCMDAQRNACTIS